MAYDNELADRIRELLAPLRGVDEKWIAGICRLIPLLSRAQLPHRRSVTAETAVKNQPNNRLASPETEMSSINRRHTFTLWGGRGSNPRPTD
jgi:hypothetical protein